MPSDEDRNLNPEGAHKVDRGTKDSGWKKQHM